MNCASIPRELFESEFFGHVKGAFTGALRDRVGRFQLADGGSLFLDEVAEIPVELQCKLLRVLQEGEFELVGEDRARRVNVRVIAATNRDLEKEVAASRFRQGSLFSVALEKNNGKIYGSDGAAELLGMRPTTLSSKIATLKIKRSKRRS